MSRVAAMRGRFAPVVGALVLLTLSVAVGAGVGGGYSTIGLGIVLAVSGMVCLAYPFLGALVLASSAFWLNWLIHLRLAPSSTQFVQEALALTLLAAVVVHTRHRQHLLGYVMGGVWFVVFLLLSALGAFVSRPGLLPAIVGLRNLWVFYPLAIAPVALEWGDRELRLLANVLIGAAFLQVPVALYQFVFLRTGTSGDAVGGTLGGSSSGTLTVLMMATVTLLIGMYVYRAAPPGRLALGAAVLMVPPALNETKVVFVAAPIIFGLVLLPRLRRNAGRILAVGVLLGAMVFAVFQSYAAVYGTARYRSGNVLTQMIQQELAPGTASGGVMRRLPSVAFAVDEVSSSAATFLFGHGSGSLTRSALVETSGGLIVDYGPLLRNTVFLVRLLLEYGFLGLIVFGGMLVSIYRGAHRLEREEPEPFWQAVAVWMQGLVIAMTLMSVYTGTFLSDALACTFWLVTGLCAARVARAHAAAAAGEDALVA